jgi:hypothetical protein
MDKRSLFTLAAAVLIATVSAASAAPGMGSQPSDKLELSKSQQQTAWDDLWLQPDRWNFGAIQRSKNERRLRIAMRARC